MHRYLFQESSWASVVALTLLSIAPSARGETAPSAASVLASVNDTPITVEDVDALVAEELRALQERIDMAWRNELDLQINSRLLDAEARARGLTATELLQEEVLSKVDEPRSDEIQAHFEKNRDRFPGTLADAGEAVRAELLFLRQQEKASDLAERLRARAKLARLVETPSPPKTAEDRKRVLAVVNEEEITLGDLEDELRTLQVQTSEAVYRYRKAALDRRVNDLLLEAEAERRHATPETVLSDELEARKRPVTEAEARAFLEENRERLAVDWNDEDQRLELLRYLEEREIARAYAGFASELREAATIETNLEPPTTIEP